MCPVVAIVLFHRPRTPLEGMIYPMTSPPQVERHTFCMLAGMFYREPQKKTDPSPRCPATICTFGNRSKIPEEHIAYKCQLKSR